MIPSVSDSSANTYAEHSVIGSVLISREAFEQVRATGLEPEDFSDPFLRTVWRAAIEVGGTDDPVDLVTVSQRLLEHGAFPDNPGWMGDMVGIVAPIATVAYAGHHARHLRRRGQMRRKIRGSLPLLASAGDGDANAEELHDWAEDLAHGLDSAGPLRFTESEDAMADLDSPDAVTLAPLPTGIEGLDRINPGLAPGAFVLIAGRTSSGKTCLMLDIARFTATAGKRVAIVSLEMNKNQINSRLIAAESGIATSAVSMRTWPVHQAKAFSDAVNKIAGWDLRSVYVQTLGIDGLRALILGLYPRPDLVVLDYLQLMERRRGASTNDAIAEVSRGLKVLAGEIGCVLLVGSQLSRSSAHEDRPPELHDLRDSGSLEQDADSVIMLDRWYEEFKDARGKVTERVEDSGRRRIYWRKQRDGRTGETESRFWGESTTFRLTGGQ